jgi:hypothetical protein
MLAALQLNSTAEVLSTCPFVRFTKATLAIKRQTRPLVREGAPHGQDSKCQTETSIWS